MSAQTVTLLIDAGLFGLATALVCLAFGLAGFAAWQVYGALWSPQAQRRKRFKANSRKRVAHYRRMLGLAK